jgi:hypothetical protein
MKGVLIIFFLLINCNINAQVFSLKDNTASDQTSALQTAFNNKDVSVVLINTPNVIINGTLNIPPSKVLRFEPGCKITGHGTINGGIIEAGYQSNIFDTTLTVNPKAVGQYFSVKWFGAVGTRTADDYNAIQKSITTCLKNNIRTLFIPAGRYKISRPLILRGEPFCTLEIVGESTFWDSNMGSEIYPDFNNTFAIGIQGGKGCMIHKLKLVGLFKPPFMNDRMKFFNTKFEDFTDGICRDSRNSPYSAIVIDPFTNLATDPMPADGGYPSLTSSYGKAKGLATQSGSTGTQIEDMIINNFVVGICSAPNGLTRNAEITIINKIQFENCKLCVSGGQDQEKGNTVSNIYCWGGTHTIFATGLYGTFRQAGNWNIDHANIAGGVVRFIYNIESGYFSTHVSHVFAEELGTWGTFSSELAADVSDCMVDFAYPETAGEQTLITSWGENVVYRSCNFRYYGQKRPLRIEGNCTFDHCFFSGPINKSTTGAISHFFFTNNTTSITLTLAGLIALFFIALKLYKHSRRKHMNHELSIVNTGIA